MKKLEDNVKDKPSFIDAWGSEILNWLPYASRVAIEGGIVYIATRCACLELRDSLIAMSAYTLPRYAFDWYDAIHKKGRIWEMVTKKD